MLQALLVPLLMVSATFRPTVVRSGNHPHENIRLSRFNTVLDCLFRGKSIDNKLYKSPRELDVLVCFSALFKILGLEIYLRSA